MKFRITSPWSLFGSTWIVPADTIIDASSNDRWSQRAKGKVIPLNAVPIDAEAYEAQLKAYPDSKHLLGGGWQ
jgi:hypothetical protein